MEVFEFQVWTVDAQQKLEELVFLRRPGGTDAIFGGNGFPRRSNPFALFASCFVSANWIVAKAASEPSWSKGLLSDPYARRKGLLRLSGTAVRLSMEGLWEDGKREREVRCELDRTRRKPGRREEGPSATRRVFGHVATCTRCNETSSRSMISSG